MTRTKEYVDGKEVFWKPLSKNQDDFIKSNADETLFMGGKGNGKTESLIYSFIATLGDKRNSKFVKGLILRATLTDMTQLINRFREIGESIGIFSGKNYENRALHIFTMKCGATLRFANMKSVENYRGTEYTFIGIDEVCDMRYEEDYEEIRALLRSIHTTEDFPLVLKCTGNPRGVGRYWVYKRFLDALGKPGVKKKINNSVRQYLHGNLYDSEEMAKLNAATIKLYSSLSPEQRDAYVYGICNPVGPGGSYFGTVWDPNVHVVEPFEIPPGWRINRSYDPGTTSPFSVGWWAESDGSPYIDSEGNRVRSREGDLYRISEIYGADEYGAGWSMDHRTIANMIHKRDLEIGIVEGGVADLNIFDSIGTRDDYDFLEFYPVEGVNKNRVAGWQRMLTMFMNAITKKAEGLYAFSNCEIFIKYIPELRTKINYPEDIQKCNIDHVADESRYRVMTPLGTSHGYSLMGAAKSRGEQDRSRSGIPIFS